MGNKDRYERAKQYICGLIDLAKKYNLKPTVILEVMVLEGITSWNMLGLGKEVMKDIVKLSKEHGVYVDERINSVISRFDKIKEECKKFESEGGE